MSALTGKGFVTAAGGFNPGTVGASAIFDGSADYLSQTPSAGNRDRFICGAWVLRTGGFGTAQSVLSAGPDGNNRFFIVFDGNNSVAVRNDTGGVIDFRYVTDAFYRDIGWYHIVFSYENGSGELYVNGEKPTLSTTTNAPAGTDAFWNSANTHAVGRLSYTGVFFFNGYIAQPFNIDAKSIQNTDHTIDDFGQFFTAGTNGTIWSPKPDAEIAALAAAAGGNSFCLTDGIAAGTDASSNGNDFTPAGSPTASENTPSKVYPVWNVLNRNDSAPAPTNGGLTASVAPGGNYAGQITTMAVKGGKWYWEIVVDAEGGAAGFTNEDALPGLAADWDALRAYSYATASSGTYSDGEWNEPEASSGTVYTTVTTGNVLGFALDLDNGKSWVSINDTWVNSGDPAAGTGEVQSGLNTDVYYAPTINRLAGSGSFTARFIESDFTGTVPTGFKAINSANLTAPTYQGADWFNVLAVTPTASNPETFTGAGFSPDLAWLKDRDTSRNHYLYDKLRGVLLELSSNLTAAEPASASAGGLIAFEADGFTWDTSGGYTVWGDTGSSDVAWLWRGDGTSGTTNTDGSITSTVNVAAPGHFSIVSWTETTNANQSIGHGLTDPDLIITKSRSNVAAWYTWTNDIGMTLSSGNYLVLNNTLAAQTDGISAGIHQGSNSLGTSTFLTGNNAIWNGDNIAYVFKSVPGVCKVGSYIGNGSADGPYVHLSFKPRWVLMAEVTAATYKWHIWDTERPGYNPIGGTLWAEKTDAENTTAYVDLLSDGFKLRTNGVDLNANSVSYIYLAMADVAGGGILPPIPGR